MTAQTDSTPWRPGDKVIHAGKPEWGVGTVSAVSTEKYEGRSVQRVTARFERAGLKVVSTAVAKLRPAGDVPPRFAPVPEAGADGPEKGWLDGLEAKEIEQRLRRVPEGASDPFRSARDRLAETLKLYRFSKEGGSLLDWAAAQTGLADPLSRFSRHDLELHFDHFRRNLDEHLGRVHFELKKADPGAADALMAKAPPAAQQALRRGNFRR